MLNKIALIFLAISSVAYGMEVSSNLESDKSEEYVSESSPSSLIEAAVQEYSNYLAKLADKQNVNYQMSKFDSLLDACIQACLTESVKFLISDGQINNATHEYSNYLIAFLDKKNINNKSSKGNTALMVAVNVDLIESVKFFLSLGADTNIANDNGQTALDIAQENGHEEIASLISYYQETTDDEADEESELNNNSANNTKKRKYNDNVKTSKPFICNKHNCGRFFYSQKDLDKHAQRHDLKRKIFVCDYPDCNKAYFNQTGLNAHKKIHTGEGLSCIHCGKMFAYISQLTIHERVHTGEKPYVCDYENCGNSFSTKQGLFAHQRTHTKNVHFVCNHPGCKAAFTDRSSLRLHSVKHLPLDQ